jgi:hypothetical protein
MKRKYSFIFVLTISPSVLFAQLFTKINSGPVVSTYGDSRSVNFVDVNNDGWEDVFISNGPEDGDANFLYLNNSDGTFTDSTGNDIVMSEGAYDGATFADYDNDGDADCFVVTWWNQKNHFFRNNGDGNFTEDENILPATLKHLF